MDHAASQLVTVFGGSGFVGTQLVQDLAKAGYRVRVAVRRPDLAGHLKPLGNVGQIQPIQANVRDFASVLRATQGADVVVNLTGILFAKGRQSFGAVHAQGARNVATAARDAGVTRLVHMSALGADPASPSAYARSRAQGEEEVLKAFGQAIIVRPSIIFGKGDGFFNLFASLARLFPVLPLISGKSLFQPVYVGDVAQALALAVAGAVPGGRIYELGGPEVASFKALLERMLAETGRSNPLIPLPQGLAKLIAMPMELLPHPLLTRDQVIQLGRDNKVSEAAIAQGRTFEAFGIAPTGMEAVLSTYLWRFRKNGQFDKLAVTGTRSAQPNSSTAQSPIAPTKIRQ